MTTKQEFPLDRSAIFTALLTVPAFAGMAGPEYEAVITECLAAWYKSPDTNMFTFARTWAKNYFDTLSAD